MESLRLSGKCKHNVMMCFHAFLDDAWRAKRIPEIPPFPRRSDHKIVAPSIKWLGKPALCTNVIMTSSTRRSSSGGLIFRRSRTTLE